MVTGVGVPKCDSDAQFETPSRPSCGALLLGAYKLRSPPLRYAERGFRGSRRRRARAEHLTAGWGSGKARVAANARMVRLTNHAARGAYRTVAGSSFGAQHASEPAHPPNHLPVTVARRLAGHFSSAGTAFAHLPRFNNEQIGKIGSSGRGTCSRKPEDTGPERRDRGPPFPFHRFPCERPWAISPCRRPTGAPAIEVFHCYPHSGPGESCHGAVSPVLPPHD